MDPFLSFNLVIEVLFFSSQRSAHRDNCPTTSFNLVIEVLFFSSRDVFIHSFAARKFQSRNRGSFLFKGNRIVWATRANSSFNLVIEVLFFSRTTYRRIEDPPSSEFQSRNRGSFLFKWCAACSWWMARHCFNLVIEVLFFSSGSVSTDYYRVVIARFQSRNRGSFLFKWKSVLPS